MTTYIMIYNKHFSLKTRCRCDVFALLDISISDYYHSFFSLRLSNAIDKNNSKDLDLVETPRSNFTFAPNSI